MNRRPPLAGRLANLRSVSRRRFGIVRDHLALRRRYKRRPDALDLHGVALQLGAWTPDEIRNQIYEGRYESPEREVVTKTLRQDDIVLEIGSGLGYLTTVASGIAREVRSFDANPAIVEVARNTVARNGLRATVTNAILERSPSRSTAPFHIHKYFPESSLVPSEHTVKTVAVPVLDFDVECGRCTYLLVDIEGAEVDLLRAELPGVRAICVECHPQAVSARQITDMLLSLFGQGFTIDVSVSNGQVLYLSRS
jgi:FkbM family methyltransferase